jgi:transcriptional regulator with XRE-family HTH domain
MKSKRRQLSAIARKVSARMGALGLNQAVLVRRSGLSPAYVSELLRGDKKGVKHAKLVALANALEVPVIYLTMDTRPSPLLGGPFGRPRAIPEDIDPDDYYRDQEEREAHRNEPFPRIFPFPLCHSFRPTDRLGELIPLYVTPTSAGTLIDPAAVGTIERPPLLASVAGAYAVLADARLAPRYLAGEVLYVGPDSRPHSGDYVFVILRADIDVRPVGRAWRLNYLANGYAEVESFEPPMVEQIDLDRIAYIHRIVLAGEATLKR